MRTLHLVGSPTATSSLIERSAEIEAIDTAVRDGGVVVIEAAAGLGKTALLEQAASRALDAGYLVRRAAPAPLERHFPYGVVRALLEAPLGTRLDDAGTDSVEFAHNLLWLCTELAAEHPLALLVDDAQWADRLSLEVLAYLARRAGDLALLIVVATREPDPQLSLLGNAVVLHPAPLSPRGAAQLIGRADVALECHRVTGGNPWLLAELGADAIAPEATVSPSARAVIRRRLAELTPRERGVAEALAVIGDGAAPHVAAAVAGVPVGELGPARDALSLAGLLTPDGSRFAHALIAAAITEELTPTERERLHREAARALIALRADARLIASHLLECSPQSDPEVSEHLRAAAAIAMDAGLPAAAATYLERALDERAPGDDRGRMLAELGTVAFDAGLPDSRRLLHEALPEVTDRDDRIDLLTRLASLNLVQPGDAELVDLFDAELEGETDPDVRLAIEAARLDALLTVPERHAERARLVAAIDLSRADDPLLQRVVLAHRAWVGIELGTAGAATGATLALEALDGGLLLADAHRRRAYAICARVLMAADHPEAGAVILAMRDEAVRRGSLRLRVAAAWYAAEHALRTGRVSDAETSARMALELVDEDQLNTFTGGAIEVLVCALAERGAFEEAHELLREHGLDGELGTLPWQISVRHARARLALAEGNYEL
ncbi:MAG TPA: AAA family ATPase, partial [Solirubrobacter sp.]|nr:AAA family ATPase [Solirubrobacter sp.]